MQFNDGWILFSRADDSNWGDLYQLLTENGIHPREYNVYGEFRGFLQAQGISTDKAIAWHQGHYIGDIDTVRRYLATHTEQIS